MQPQNYQPYIPANTGVFGEYGWSGILRGAGVVFFVFLGFDIISTAAQETKIHSVICLLVLLVLC
jgi:APA family basic amino acid/polyamine antiporter